ncbi:MAG: S-formylglutathione hydrolase [Proteobacteria bacterium]|nr:S-formylglutathione hydrolase [Pseudomonadota bacterium]
MSDTPPIETLSLDRTFGGAIGVYSHASRATGTPMRFSVFTPEGPGPFPVLVWLSGLTCTEQNFTTKAGAYRSAAEHRLMIVAPDTSPRGEGVADDPSDSLGQGAGFYVDATQAPWAPHFRMESYVVQDLIEAVVAHFPADRARIGVSGHSMGGHGALTLGLRHPDLFRSVSAFAPIVSPTNCPWGQIAFSAYLGPDREAWKLHDAVELVKAGAGAGFDEILIDQGDADGFLERELMPDLLIQAAQAAGRNIRYRMQPGYSHSYWFVSTFIADHIAFHAARL